MDDFLFSAGFSLAVERNSVLLHDLNGALHDLDTEGDLQKLHHRWWVERSDCQHVTDVQGKMYRSASRSRGAHGGRLNLAAFLFVIVLGLSWKCDAVEDCRLL